MFAAPQHAQHAYAPPCACMPARLQPASAARGVQQPSAWVLAPAGQAQHAQPPAVQHDLAMRRRCGERRAQPPPGHGAARNGTCLSPAPLLEHITWFCVCRLYQKHQTAVQREYAAWPGFPIAQTAGAGVCKRSVFQVGKSDLRSHQGPRRRQAAAPGAVRRCVPPRTRCCCPGSRRCSIYPISCRGSRHSYTSSSIGTAVHPRTAAHCRSRRCPTLPLKHTPGFQVGGAPLILRRLPAAVQSGHGGERRRRRRRQRPPGLRCWP